MPRSFLNQLLQVAASSTYNDAVASPHTPGVAEGQSELEGDLNVLRTLVKDLHGETNWYDAPDMDLKSIANKYFIEFLHQSGFEDVASGTGTSSTAFDTAIKTITNHNNGQGDSTTGGVITNGTKAYKCQVRDHDSQDPIDDGSGNEVYGRLSYVGGNYTLTWYSLVSGVETSYNFTASVDLDLAFVAVSRRFEDMDWGVFLDPEFHDTSGFAGTIDDSNVTTGPWSFLLSGQATAQQAFDKLDKLGSTANGEGASGIAVEDASNYYTGTDIEAVLDEIEAQIGGATSTTYDFTENNVLADNDAIYAALNKLDLYWGDLASQNNGEGASLVGIEDAGGYTAYTNVEDAIQEIYGLIADVSGWDKVSETTASPITSGNPHTLPGSKSYTPNSGQHLDVYYNGQLLLEGSGNDYSETTGTTITFNFTVPTNANLTYMIRK